MNHTLFAVNLPPWATFSLAALIIFLAVWGIVRRVDVRLCLFVSALALGLLAGNPFPIFRTFLETLSAEKFVVPICCAMGFAYVLRHTGCDKHLVHVLVRPLSKVRPLLIPGTIVVGFVLNTPIISQTSTVASIGPVIIPILLAARISPLTAGAALLLGCSMGGELLNPGAPELATVADDASMRTYFDDPSKLNLRQRTINHIFPLDMVGLGVAVAVFWFLSLRAERKFKSTSDEESSANGENETVADKEGAFRINYLYAAVPFVPLVLLYIVSPPLELFHVPESWLLTPVKTQTKIEKRDANAVAGEKAEQPATAKTTGSYPSRRIGLMMFVGVMIAAVVVWRKAPGVPTAFFEGAGFAFTRIISLIVTARCFGTAVQQIGIAELVKDFIEANPALLIPLAGILPMLFGVLSGSGMASTQSLFHIFGESAVQPGINTDPTFIGAVVSLGSAAGRTMSPVAAVVFMTATLTKTDPLALVRRVALPLIASTAAIIIVAIFMN